jgi:hypothetical protein
VQRSRALTSPNATTHAVSCLQLAFGAVPSTGAVPLCRPSRARWAYLLGLARESGSAHCSDCGELLNLFGWLHESATHPPVRYRLRASRDASPAKTAKIGCGARGCFNSLA